MRGRAVDVAGQAINDVGVFARHHPRWGHEDDDGHFEITGIEKGAPAEIFVTVGAVTLPVRLNAVQTMDNVDLGDVQSPPEEGDAVAKLTLDHAGWTSHFLEVSAPGISLISNDGQHILSFSGDQQGRALAHQSPLLPLPPGTYYLVPGVFTPDRPVHLAALDLVRSGQAADVEGWPKLVAVSGQTVDLTINAAAVDQIITQAAGEGK